VFSVSILCKDTVQSPYTKPCDSFCMLAHMLCRKWFTVVTFFHKSHKNSHECCSLHAAMLLPRALQRVDLRLVAMLCQRATRCGCASSRCRSPAWTSRAQMPASTRWALQELCWFRAASVIAHTSADAAACRDCHNICSRRWWDSRQRSRQPQPSLHTT
jgi:hypothetical protein